MTTKRGGPLDLWYGRRATKAVRYPSLDAMRGLALVAMASAHLTYVGGSSYVKQVTHAAAWVDGAFFFVALSGVVTGLVHRRLVARDGLRASSTKLVRRAALIYAVHVGLVVLTVSAASIEPNLLHETPTWSEVGVVAGMGDILSLTLQPNFIDVLPMYVVFLLLAVPAVAALRRGWYWVVAAASLAIYAAGLPFGGFPLVDGSFAITSWQVLFMAGLMVGWAWEHELSGVGPLLRRAILVGAAATSMVFVFLAMVARDPTDDALGPAIAKFEGGLVAFVFAGAALVIGYAVFESIGRLRWTAMPQRPLQILGTKGLSGFVAMVLCVLFLDVNPSLPRNDVVLVLILAVCGLTEFGMARFERWRGRALAERATTAALAQVVSATAPKPDVAQRS